MNTSSSSTPPPYGPPHVLVHSLNSTILGNFRRSKKTQGDIENLLRNKLHIENACNFLVSLYRSLFSENSMGLKKNVPNHYLKLEFLKLHFVCFCFAADFQANPTDISSKKSGKIQTTSLR